MFPEVINQRKHLRRSAKVFRDQVTSQILPDGGHSELASMYHLIVAGELQEIVALMRRNGLPDTENFDAQLQASLHFSRALIRPDGSMSLLGDSATDDNNIRFSVARVGLSDLNYWILNEAKTELLPPNADKKGLSVEVFPSSGYAFIRNESDDRSFSSTFDFGAFSRNPATDHGHNDALSFDLHALGRPIIVDPGVCFPRGPVAIPHDYFRGTTAHNTLMIDEREQSKIWRKSDVRKTAITDLLNLNATKEIIEIEASCVAYWVTKKTLIHARKIRYLATGQLEIHDNVRGAGKHNLKWFFHFSPDINIVTSADGGISGLDTRGVPIFTLVVNAVKTPVLSILKGRVNPPLGWMSCNSTNLEATYTTIYDICVELPFQCSFEIRF